MRGSSLRRLSTIISAGVAGLLVAAGIGFQDNLFRHWMDPRSPFQTTPAPPAPDYATADAWALRPTTPSTGGVAVFFVHPTTYWGGRAWNAPIDHAAARERLQREALPNFVGPFVDYGQVWAPRYRQASLFSALTHRFDARRARALAYEDVAAAFKQFLSEAPAESEIILVGVEQGGLHALGLLQDMFRAETVRDRLVAAYIIDQAVPLDLFNGALAHLTPCERAKDTRCVVAWGAEPSDDGREIRRFQRRSMVWTPDGRLDPTAGRALLCVNPVLRTRTEDYAPPRLHAGAVDATGMALGVAPAPVPAQTSAQCRDGVLLVDPPTAPSLRESWSWGGRFKPPTVNLFYADIRDGLGEKLGVVAQRREREGYRAPPLDGTVEIEDSPINPVPEG